MHDCRKTEELLIDLVFGESDESPQLRAEIESCPRCVARYRSLKATLSAFDQAADSSLPDESYWAGYDAKLQARLAEPEQPKVWERLLIALNSFWSKPGVPIAVAASLGLLIAATILWVTRTQHDANRPMTVDQKHDQQPSPSARVPETETAKDQTQSVKKTERQVAVKVTPHQRRRGLQRANKDSDNLLQARFIPSPVRPNVLLPSVSTDTTFAPARHFEKAQILLRSFRNARVVRKGSAFDLGYEKEQSRKLVFDNILLRRAAAAKGNLPVEEVLNSLEPLLLDIANLPDRPSSEEVQTIRKRMQKQEIVATLQLYSANVAKPGMFESPDPLLR